MQDVIGCWKPRKQSVHKIEICNLLTEQAHSEPHAAIGRMLPTSLNKISGLQPNCTYNSCFVSSYHWLIFRLKAFVPQLRSQIVIYWPWFHPVTTVKSEFLETWFKSKQVTREGRRRFGLTRHLFNMLNTLWNLNAVSQRFSCQWL